MKKEEEKPKKRKEVYKGLNWERIRQQAQAHASVNEICAHNGIRSRTTLYERCEKEMGISLSDFMESCKDHGKLMLKESMFNSALDGNTSMQIWLSKNWLQYKDKHDVTTNNESINKPVIEVTSLEMKKDVEDFIKDIENS